MRKIYTLLTGLLCTLVMLKTHSQDHLNPFQSESEVNTGYHSNNEKENQVQLQPATCGAEIVSGPVSSSPLTRVFKAIPLHSQQKKPVYICWNFGDGSDTCIQYSLNDNGPYQVVHHYAQPGTYTVCVTITYQDGCQATKCKSEQVGESCTADFHRMNLASSPNPLLVVYKAIPGHSQNKKPKKICWQFGDGKDTCIEYPNNYTGSYLVRHRYTEPGQYNVCIKITYYGGCEADLCKSVQVGRRDECKADFEKIPVTNPDHPLVTGFKALPWHNNNKKPKKICWSFGDGQDTCVEYAQNYSGPYVIRHRYNAPGNYNVCVKIIYYGGCEARKCKPVTIPRPDECKADFEKLDLSISNHPLTSIFKALPSHNNGKKPKQICWKFGDGKDTCIEYPANFTGNYTVRHTYREPGNYEVCVKILYYGGCEARKCKNVQIGRKDECKADFEKLAVTTGTHPLTTLFKAIPSHNNNKKPKLICWKFGDGKDTCIEYGADYAGQYTVRHTYREPGNYEVCVKIMYYGGCEARKCKEVQVGPPAICKADFEKLKVSSSANPLTAVFKAEPWHANNKKPKVICWKFGDGKDTCIEYGEDYNGNYLVSHTYRQPGQYEVCVKIKYFGGCEASKCERVKIESPGECRVKLFELTPSATSLTRGFYAQPWHSGNKRPVRICWYFGDGTDTCIILNPTGIFPGLFIRHTYPGPGVYRACVKILYEGGCIATDCEEVVIRPSTNVCGGFMTDSLISPRTFRFKAFAIHNPDDPVVSYRWSFGDGTSASGKEVTKRYHQPGRYEVCLEIKTQKGCVTRICKPLFVHGFTVAGLQMSPNPVTNNSQVIFNSTMNEQVNIQVISNTGVVVKHVSKYALSGENRWDLDLSNLTPGSYTVTVRSVNQFSSDLLIKQ